MNPGPGDIDLDDARVLAQVGHDQFGERARIDARFLRQHHGGVGGEVAMRASRGGSRTTRLTSSPAGILPVSARRPSASATRFSNSPKMFIILNLDRAAGP